MSKKKQRIEIGHLPGVSPCPICGSADIMLTFREANRFSMGSNYRIVCNVCGNTTYGSNMIEGPVHSWCGKANRDLADRLYALVP